MVYEEAVAHPSSKILKLRNLITDYRAQDLARGKVFGIGSL